MNTCRIPQTDLVVSRLGFGSASLIAWDRELIRPEDLTKAARLIDTACEQGITLFDHADVYAFGKAEEAFGKVLKQRPGLRNRIVIQSKCGQRFSQEKLGSSIRVDLSQKHIVSTVEGTLRRLGTHYLDILLLHAADPLVEPDEVAHAFEGLHQSGKVRYFGVSNYEPCQIALLKRSVRQPLVIDQIQLGIASPNALAEGMRLTLWIAKGGAGSMEEMNLPCNGTIDYCRLNDIQVQAWSPLRGVLNPPASDNPLRRERARLISDLAHKRNTTPAVIALAWLLRHPAGIVPILGSNNPAHLIENCAADRVALEREEWYDLFATAA